MDEPLSPDVEAPPLQRDFQQLNDREAEFAQTACFVALLILSILATLVLGLTLTVTSRNLLPNELHAFLLSILSTLEFGEIVFLSHGWFMLSRFTSTRFVAPVGSISIAAIQLATVSTLGGANSPSVFTFCMVALVFYFASLWMAGWFFHRLFGASLSFGSQDVFQEAIGTKVLLMLPPFLVALGFVPIIGSMILGNAITVNSAVVIVSSSLAMLGATTIPLATIYLLIVLVRLKGYVRYIAVVAVMTIIGIAVAIDWTTKFWTLSIMTGFVAAYVIGVGLGLAPFVWYGFWPVWAKRKRIAETERSVSFDDVV